jgi:hypothetical protein
LGRLTPEEDHAKVLEDLQFHGRCLAVEFKSVGIACDTLVRLPERPVLEGWEIPAGDLPADRPLMLSMDGIYPSEAPRIIGREVKPLSENDIAAYGAALAIRQMLFNLEKKHDIFGKIREDRGSNFSIPDSA